MALIGRQYRQLRSLAHHLDPVVMVGQNGVTDAVVGQAGESLEAHELIKVQVQESSGLSAREAGEAMAERLGAELVQVIGRRVVLYRRSGRKDVEHIQI